MRCALLCPRKLKKRLVKSFELGRAQSAEHRALAYLLDQCTVLPCTALHCFRLLLESEHPDSLNVFSLLEKVLDRSGQPAAPDNRALGACVPFHLSWYCTVGRLLYHPPSPGRLAVPYRIPNALYNTYTSVWFWETWTHLVGRTNTTRPRGSVRKARLSSTTDLELALIKLFGLVGVLR